MKRALSIREFTETYGTSRTVAYHEMKSGRLEYAAVGRRRLIPTEAADRWLKSKTVGAVESGRRE